MNIESGRIRLVKGTSSACHITVRTLSSSPAGASLDERMVVSKGMLRQTAEILQRALATLAP